MACSLFTPESFDDKVDEEEPEQKSKSLAKIPDNLLRKSSTDWEPINYRGVDVAYDLYDQAKVHIAFDEKEQKLIYAISEPKLTEEEQDILEELNSLALKILASDAICQT